MTDKELAKLLGLDDRTIKLTLEDDIVNTMGGFIKDIQEHEQKKKEFVALFKECFNELCVFMENDPKHRVPISCFTCIKGMDLSKQYGMPRKSK